MRTQRAASLGHQLAFRWKSASAACPGVFFLQMLALSTSQGHAANGRTAQVRNP